MIAIWYSNIRYYHSTSKNTVLLDVCGNMSKSQSCISNSRSWCYQRQGHGFDYVYLKCKVALDKSVWQSINNKQHGITVVPFLGYCITVTCYRCHVLIFVNLPCINWTYVHQKLHSDLSLCCNWGSKSPCSLLLL